MKPEYDVTIVGGGPSGLSAALLLGRCMRRIVICDAGNPRNSPSRAMHAFLGGDGMNPAEFLSESRKQIALYDSVEFSSGMVHHVERENGIFLTHGGDGRVFRSRALLLATGVRDRLPDVPSAKQFYGVTLHHCPYCDGWEHRGQHIGVIGMDKSAADLALELLLWSPQVSIYTNAEATLAEDLRRGLIANGIDIVEGTVTALHGMEANLSHVQVKGQQHPCEALFFSPMQVHQSSLAQSLGCAVEPETGAITCGLDGATGVDGLFVAGNVSTGLQMVMMAAAEGLSAAAVINDWLVCCDTRTS